MRELNSLNIHWFITWQYFMCAINPYLRQKIVDIFFRYFNNIVGYFLYFFSRTFIFLNITKSGYALLLKSIRYNYNNSAIRYLKSTIVSEKKNITCLISNSVSEREAQIRSIILSSPIINDNKILKKGVMIVTFTRTASFYLRQNWFDKLDELFVFILEPSSAGYADPDILAFISNSTHCLVQATEIKDRVFLNSLYPENIALSFGASNWVDPDIFRPLQKAKIYDSIYVANLNPVKRIYRFVDAIKYIIQKHDPQYKACLVCGSWGGKKGHIEKYIGRHGLSQNISFFPGLKREELLEKLNESKVNILLSYKEGSSRSLFESMFANIPVICLGENIGVNKCYINEYTGLLTTDESLEDALMEMKSGWSKYQPRKWALKYISPEVTTKALSEILIMKFGSICNAKLFIKTNRPEVEYRNSSISTERINKILFKIVSEADNIVNIRNELEIMVSLIKENQNN